MDTNVDAAGSKGILDIEPVDGPSNQTLRRSSRQLTTNSGVSKVVPTQMSPLEHPVELLLIYRPVGTGAVNITRADVERLQPGTYLNDTLIEFGLKLWLSDVRDCNPELADQIYLFSSFFYKKMAIKDIRQGYNGVRKWTSKVDLFSKKYLVVPINEDLHWYLAIICNPEHVLRPTEPTSSPVTGKRKLDDELSVEASEMEEILDSASSSPKMEYEEQTEMDYPSNLEEWELEYRLCEAVSSVSLKVQGEPRSPVVKLGHLSLTSSVDEDNSLDPNATSVEGFYGSGPIDAKLYSKMKPPALSSEMQEGGARGWDIASDADATSLNVDRTYIFIFDSLNRSHPGAMRNLGQYLRFEAMDKKGNYNADYPETIAVPVPTQDNSCDCGIYLLHFAKVFMHDPLKAFHTILTKRTPSTSERDMNWKKELVGTSREDLTNRILNLSVQWFKERAKEVKETAKGKARARTANHSSTAESDNDVTLEDVIIL